MYGSSHEIIIQLQLMGNSMKRSTWMWKSNFVQSIDNVVSLESWDIQEFIFISFNFTKKDWADFFKIEYEGLAKTKNLVFLVVLFEISFRRQSNFFFNIDWTRQLVKDTKTCLKCENQSKVFSLDLLDAKPGIFSLCTSVTKILQKFFPCSIQQEFFIFGLDSK